jgi:transcriptional regulator GlxA family with amidase domain
MVVINMNSRLHHIQDWQKLAREANCSVAVMSKLCGVSVRTVERYFLKNLGQKPKKWLAEQRLSQAFEFLQNGFSVKEIASQLGYKSAHHFSRDFKKQFGLSPTVHANLFGVKSQKKGRCRDLV